MTAAGLLVVLNVESATAASAGDSAAAIALGQQVEVLVEQTMAVLAGLLVVVRVLNSNTTMQQWLWCDLLPSQVVFCYFILCPRSSVTWVSDISWRS